MNAYNIESDQLYKWSDYEKRKCFLFTAEKGKACSTAFEVRDIYHQRFFNRALQTLRETRMQMCRNPWAWAKVLFINKYACEFAGDGLRTVGVQGEGKEVFKEFPYYTGYFGRDLYDQSGTPPAEGEVLSNKYGSPCRIRHFGSWNFSSEHVRRLFKRRYRSIFYTGGER